MSLLPTDQDYNPRLSVPDIDQRIRTLSEGSAAVLARGPVHQDIRYGPSTPEVLDIFPTGQANAPVHIFLHGGFWRSLSAKDYAVIATPLRARGVMAVLVNYALCPAVTLDEIVAQCRRAVAWGSRNIGSFGGDSGNMTISGHSAGGHLAMMVAEPDWPRAEGLSQHPVRGACAVSGLFDLAPFAHSWLQPVLRLDAGMIERNSPLRRGSIPACPVILAVGGAESEGFRRQMDAYAAFLSGKNAQVTALTEQGCNHMTIMDELAEGRPLGEALLRMATGSFR